MSFGKTNMSKEGMYQERQDMLFATPPPPPQQPMHHRHAGGHGENHHHQQPLECFSDEVDSRGTADRKEPAGPGAIVAHQASGGRGGDGSSIEVSTKRRGRPPGSKNKPKPPVVITREAEPAAAMRPHVIEIPAGRDVAEALARFASRRGLGICVLAGTGAVANVSLRHPCGGPTAAHPGSAAAPVAVVVFQGRFEILSISATFLPPAVAASVAPQAAAAAAGLSISLAGPHGQIVGGAVVGPLYAATSVVVVAAAFTNPTFHRLPADVDDAPAPVSASASLSGASAEPAADEHRGHQRQPEPPQGQQQHHLRRQPPHLAASAATSAAQPVVPIYACHSQAQPQELMWPLAARAPPHQQPPPPPPY